VGRLRAELAQARKALVRSQRLCAAGEICAGLSHDLRNSLGGLGLQIKLLERECAASQREALDRVGRVLRDAVETLGHLQDVARGKRGRGKETADLSEVIGDAVALARSDPRLRVEARLPALPRVFGSAPELKHVFLNLLLNARDAMPRGGRVRVVARRQGEWVQVTVTDQGRGIPARILPRIFDAFFTTKGKRGLGLGLTVASGVMERLGGAIRARNAPRGGAIFHLQFPVAGR
jgi:signal transduction histidine kinase